MIPWPDGANTIDRALSINYCIGIRRGWKQESRSRPMPAATPQMSPEEAVRRVAQAREALVGEVHKVIIGQDEMIEQMLICIFARGHCLTIGVPGLAKTLTVSTLAQALHLKFTRIQFTPDLMPSDITGTEIIDQDPATGKRTFRFVQGPVFSNIVLADEINRTPPKTQAALLQAMQEHEVTVAGNTYQLDPPFFVMATQNPIEQEGTYPLPEAQLDRFMLSINIGYPTRSEEREIVMATTQTARQEIRPVLSGQDILWIQQLVRQVPSQPAHGRLRGRPGPGDAAQGAAEPGLREELAGLGRRAAGRTVHDPRGEGPGDPARPVRRQRRRRSRHGLSRAAAPPLHQLQRRRRRDRRRPGDREDSGNRARAELRRGASHEAASCGPPAGSAAADGAADCTAVAADGRTAAETIGQLKLTAEAAEEADDRHCLGGELLGVLVTE